MKLTEKGSVLSRLRLAGVVGMAVTLGTLACNSSTPVMPPGTGGVGAAGGDYGAGGAGGSAGDDGMGGTSPGALLSGTEPAGEPVTMLLAGDTLYYATRTEVMSLPVTGGTPTLLASMQGNVVALAADDQSLYWAAAGTAGAADGQIVSVPLIGGTPSVLASDQASPNAIAVDDVNVYWMSGGGAPVGTSPMDRLAALPKTGGGAVTVLADNLPSSGPVAAASGSVVFGSWTQTLSGTVSSQISMVARTGEAVRQVATSDRLIGAIATDGTSVFWIDSNDSGADVTIDDGRIKGVPLIGGAVTVLADAQPDPRHLVLTANDVYWANQGSFANTVPGNTAGVWRSPKVGGGAQAIVSGLPLVRSLAVNAARVAYVEEIDTHAVSWSLFLAPP